MPRQEAEKEGGQRNSTLVARMAFEQDVAQESAVRREAARKEVVDKDAAIDVDAEVPMVVDVPAAASLSRRRGGKRRCADHRSFD